MLLEVMAFARNVGVHLLAVGEAYTGYFPQSGVRFLGGSGVHACADTTTLGAAVQSRRFRLKSELFAPFPYELLDGRHLILMLFDRLIFRTAKVSKRRYDAKLRFKEVWRPRALIMR